MEMQPKIWARQTENLSGEFTLCFAHSLLKNWPFAVKKEIKGNRLKHSPAGLLNSNNIYIFNLNKGVVLAILKFVKDFNSAEVLPYRL